MPSKIRTIADRSGASDSWAPIQGLGIESIEHRERGAADRFARLLRVGVDGGQSVGDDTVRYDERRRRRRSGIETMSGRLKDWRRVATRHDRCPTAFFSTVALAALAIFWL